MWSFKRIIAVLSPEFPHESCPAFTAGLPAVPGSARVPPRKYTPESGDAGWPADGDGPAASGSVAIEMATFLVDLS